MYPLIDCFVIDCHWLMNNEKSWLVVFPSISFSSLLYDILQVTLKFGASTHLRFF